MPAAERLAWTPAAWEDYLYWQGQDRKQCRRINQLIQEKKTTVMYNQLICTENHHKWFRRVLLLPKCLPTSAHLSFTLKASRPYMSIQTELQFPVSNDKLFQVTY